MRHAAATPLIEASPSRFRIASAACRRLHLRRARGRDEAGDGGSLRGGDVLSPLRRREGQRRRRRRRSPCAMCDSIACDIGRLAARCSTQLPARLGTGRSRSCTRPASAAATRRPSPIVGQNPVPHATAGKVSTLVQAKAVKDIITARPLSTMRRTARAGGYELAASLRAAAPGRARKSSAAIGRLRVHEARRRRLSSGPQMEDCRGRTGAVV